VRIVQATNSIYGALADAVLLLHFSFVILVVGGLVVVWLGHFRGWGFVRNPYFRLAHLAAMGCVIAESLLGMVCPLTVWENRLRALAGEGRSYSGSFIQDWVHRLMFFEVREGTFTLIYVGFFALILLSWWIVPPRWNRRGSASAPTGLRRSG